MVQLGWGRSTIYLCIESEVRAKSYRKSACDHHQNNPSNTDLKSSSSLIQRKPSLSWPGCVSGIAKLGCKCWSASSDRAFSHWAAVWTLFACLRVFWMSGPLLPTFSPAVHAYHLPQKTPKPALFKSRKPDMQGHSLKASVSPAEEYKVQLPALLETKSEV